MRSLAVVGVLAGVLAVGACKDKEGAVEAVPMAFAAADTAEVAGAGTGGDGRAQDQGDLNPEDGDLVGTEFHGDMAVVSSGQAYARDLDQHFPDAYALWQSYVARVNTDNRDWVSHLEATGSPMKFVTVGGQSWVQGWVCETHNCGGNEVVFLMSPDQSQIKGYLRLTLDNGQGIERVIGPVSPNELRCMKVFMDDVSGATSC
jgi:hypothetical protein